MPYRMVRILIRDLQTRHPLNGKTTFFVKETLFPGSGVGLWVTWQYEEGNACRHQTFCPFSQEQPSPPGEAAYACQSSLYSRRQRPRNRSGKNETGVENYHAEGELFLGIPIGEDAV